MSRYPEVVLLTAALLLAACSSPRGPAQVDDSQAMRQTTAAQAEPQQAPQSTAEASVQQPAPAGPADSTVASEPEPEPIDYNQQFYEQAVSALKQGETGLAIELLLTVSRDAPEKPYVFTNLGLAHFKLQQYDLAEAAFQQAVERNSGDAVAYNHLGILQRRQGRFEAARQSYQQALEINSNYALAHLNLGILLDIYLQNLEPALHHYQRYQALQGEANETVSGWIIDLERRLKSVSS